MGMNISTILNYDSAQTQTFTLSPAASAINLDIDFSELTDCKLGIEVTYTSVSGTTGVSCTVYDGFGRPDPTCPITQPIKCKLGTAGTVLTKTNGTQYASFAGNGTSITMVTAVAGSTLTSVLFPDTVGKSTRWQRLAFANNDASQTPTIKIYVDS